MKNANTKIKNESIACLTPFGCDAGGRNYLLLSN